MAGQYLERHREEVAQGEEEGPTDEEAPVDQLTDGQWEDKQEQEDQWEEGTPKSYLMDKEALIG
jgi:hypothetical protein